jgi:hypothetical protein
MKINFICAYSIDYNYIVEDAWEWDGAKNDALESGLNKIGEGLFFKIQTRSEFKNILKWRKSSTVNPYLLYNVYVDLDKCGNLDPAWKKAIKKAVRIVRDKRISEVLELK